MSKDIAGNIRKTLTKAVDKRVFPGSVIGVISAKERFVLPVGRYTYDSDSPNLFEKSIFDVASITKTIPTSLLALLLIEDGNISFDDKVTKYLPQFKGKWKVDVEMFHLLTQTVDYGFSLSTLKDKTPSEILEVILSCDLKNPPGKIYSYTNSSSIILGKIIEIVSGESLDKLAGRRLFKPLKMNDTSFSPKKSDYFRIVPTEIDPWRGRIVKGEVHDESAYVLSKNGFVGSAGLFSTVPDILNVLQVFINGGWFGGKKILDEKVINLMTSEFKIGENKVGLGWEMSPEFIGKNHSGIMFGKTGFTGCFISFDPKEKIGIVMLSNYHFPKRKKSFNKLNQTRRSIIDNVLHAGV